MPKIYIELKKKILQVAREELELNGYKKMAIRNISNNLGIAIGTIYNYFNSKDELVANILLEDWYDVVATVNQSSKKYVKVIDGIRVLYQGIYDYASKYEGLWSEYRNFKADSSVLEQRHPLLVCQIEESLKMMFSNAGAGQDDQMLNFIADTILHFSVQHVSFDYMKPIFIRLIKA